MKAGGLRVWESEISTWMPPCVPTVRAKVPTVRAKVPSVRAKSRTSSPVSGPKGGIYVLDRTRAAQYFPSDMHCDRRGGDVGTGLGA
jgi:hypothetical protein